MYAKLKLLKLLLTKINHNWIFLANSYAFYSIFFSILLKYSSKNISKWFCRCFIFSVTTSMDS